MKIKLIFLLMIPFSFILNAQKWINYTMANTDTLLRSDNIERITTDAYDTVWVATWGGGISKFDGNTWTNYTTSNSGLPSNNVYQVTIDAQGNKWIATSSGMSEFDGNNWTTYTQSNTSNGLASDWVFNIIIDSKGNKWIGTLAGVSKFDGSNWTVFNSTNSGLGDNGILAIAIDKLGNKWIGTENGIYEYNDTTWVAYTSNGLGSRYTYAIAFDTSGNKWFGTDYLGLTKFDGLHWTTYNKSDSGSTVDIIRSIKMDTFGNKWIATEGNGVYALDDNHWINFTKTNSGLADDMVTSAAIDSRGNKWFGTWGKGVSKFDAGALNVSKTLINLKSFGDTTNFEVNSNTSWKVNSNKSWLKVSKESGSDTSEITITSILNPTITPRNDTVIVSGMFIKSDTIIVTQAASPPALSVSNSVLTVTAPANSKTSFNITSNIEWIVSIDKPWLTASSLTGTDSASIDLTAVFNPYINERTAIVIVSGTGVLSDTLKITQAASPPALTVSESTSNVAAIANSSANFDITSNISWELSSDQSWLALSSTSGSDSATITITADENPMSISRNATVTILGSGITRTVTVTQAASPAALAVSTDNLTIRDTSNSTSNFDIASNIGWNVSSNKSWLTVSIASGSDTATIKVTASANPFASLRVATVTISGSSLTKTVAVTQAAAPAVLNVSTNEISIKDSANSTASFDITSNMTWSASTDQSWLTVSDDAGLDSSTISITAAANLGASPRTANILISGTGIETDSVKVTQAASVTGIAAISNAQLVVYPNPVKDKLYISFSKSINPATIRIYSIIGKELYSYKTASGLSEINLSSFTSGVYFLKIILSDNRTLTKKIIKE